VAVARPVLEQEARALDETVFLVAARGGEIAVLDKAEGSGFLRAAPQVGACVPAHATAVGKLFLALAPGDVALPPGRLPRFTPHTRASAAALEPELARVRELGFAENRDEWIPGLAAVAAPVLAKGRLAAGVAVAAPTARFEALGRAALARRAVEAAARIAARLAGQPA
jgi:DNA-binding IclR family transcriptional regulator